MDPAFGPAEIGGVIIGTLWGVGWALSKLSPKLRWMNGNGRSNGGQRDCPIRDSRELQELSRQKLVEMKAHTRLLEKMTDRLGEMGSDHAVIKDRLADLKSERSVS